MPDGSAFRLARVVGRGTVVPMNGTAKLAGRENASEAADTAERPRSPGPARAAARRQGLRTAANRTGSSNPALFFCDIKDLLAVQGVSSEPVSPEFPVKQGKNREFSQIQPRFADSYVLSG